MKLVCPSCGATHSADGLDDADARASLLIAAELPAEIGSVAVRYIGLFRPQKRSIAWSRVRTLITELAEMIKAGAVRRSGRDWPAPPAAWRRAMQQMLDSRENLELPMKSHGYLLSILAGDANKTEAQAERQTEEGRRTNRPAANRDDEDQRTATRAAHVRTATGMLVTQATTMRMRFREELTDRAARESLGDRFAADVVEEAIANWKRLGAAK